MSKSPIDYTQELVRFGSISALSNADIADHCERLLRGLEFETERIEYDDAAGIRKVNVIGKRGAGTGGLAYFAHTDVVPADPWHSDERGPFDPIVQDGRLYGRGTCDMKGSIGCMLAAAERTPRAEMKAPLYVTLTADEEIGYGGAAEVALRSKLFKEMVAGGSRGIIGEPTELEVVYAHKGTYGFRATSRGRAAHSSTREGINANLAMIPFLAEMKAIYEETETDPEWQNDEFDPPTMSWNIGINDHTKAVNITPPQSVCTVYFRPMPGMSPEKLVKRSRAAAEKHDIEFHLASAAGPLYIDPDSPFVREMLVVAEKEQPRSVAYGTDGTQFTALKNMVVFGPGSVKQAHTFDEFIELKQLNRGFELFRSTIDRWCC